jgi:NaMN:DMB phosphoribosyltransferase
VHLRRALLLFAIVLGLAAIAASVSRPRSTSEPLRAPPATTRTTDEGTRTETVSPAPDGAPAPVALTFSAADPRAQRIEAGQAATVIVEVEEAGQVSIPDLGMSDVAEPLTPAQFDVLTHAVGRHPITFMPAGADGSEERVGTLVVR